MIWCVHVRLLLLLLLLWLLLLLLLLHVCSHINSHNQVRGHRTGSSHSGAEEYPRDKTRYDTLAKLPLRDAWMYMFFTLE